MPGQTDTQYEKTPYQTDLPMVSPGPVKTPPPPPKKSTQGQVPVLAPKSPGGDSSGTTNSGSKAPMFNPLDTSNPELLVVKAIYNIVG